MQQPQEEFEPSKLGIGNLKAKMKPTAVVARIKFSSKTVPNPHPNPPPRVSPSLCRLSKQKVLLRPKSGWESYQNQTTDSDKKNSRDLTDRRRTPAMRRIAATFPSDRGYRCFNSTDTSRLSFRPRPTRLRHQHQRRLALARLLWSPSPRNQAASCRRLLSR